MNRRTAIISAAASVVATALPGQVRRRTRPGSSLPPVIDPEVGRAALEAFRAQRLDGDFAFRVALTHVPQRGDGFTLTGQLWGTWKGGPLVRLELPLPHRSPPVAGEPDPSVERGGAPGSVSLLAHGGAEVRARTWVRRTSVPGSRALELGAAETIAPLVPGLKLTPFDLQMPFAFWPHRYEGKTRTGRHVHRYLMVPPEAFAAAAPSVTGVRIELDDQFGALTRVEVLGAGGEVARTYKMRRFKKVAGQYILREVDFFDEDSRDSAKFKVLAAAVGIDLPATAFSPEALPLPLPPLDETLFEILS